MAGPQVELAAGKAEHLGMQAGPPATSRQDTGLTLPMCHSPTPHAALPGADAPHQAARQEKHRGAGAGESGEQRRQQQQPAAGGARGRTKTEELKLRAQREKEEKEVGVVLQRANVVRHW